MRKTLAFAWSSAIDLLLDAILGSLWFSLIFTLLVTGVVLLPVFGLGLPLLALGGVLTRYSGESERLRANALLGTSIPTVIRPLTTKQGWTRSFVQGIEDLKDVATWRTLLHHTASMTIGCIVVTLAWFGIVTAIDLVLGSRGFFTEPILDLLGPVAGPLLSIVIVAAVGLMVFFAGQLDRASIAPLLGPAKNAELRQKVDTLSDARQAAVDAAAIERQRIERDLHDGAQPRLVAMAMALGMAKAKLDSDPDAARALLDQAHSDAKLAITDLRQLARGIHPAVLTDRGLDAALSALASRCTVPTRVDVTLAERPTPEVEAVIYFTIAEALTNVSKHSGATSCRVLVECRDALLTASVIDDGRGGAAIGDDLGQGGLAGIVARVRSAGGTVIIESPPGGPTRLTMELPCVS